MPNAEVCDFKNPGSNLPVLALRLGGALLMGAGFALTGAGCCCCCPGSIRATPADDLSLVEALRVLKLSSVLSIGSSSHSASDIDPPPVREGGLSSDAECPASSKLPSPASSLHLNAFFSTMGGLELDAAGNSRVPEFGIARLFRMADGFRGDRYRFAGEGGTGTTDDLRRARPIPSVLDDNEDRVSDVRLVVVA